MRSRETSTAALAVLVVVAALGAWSCGGSYESPTAAITVQEDTAAPVVAASTAADGEGDVTASCKKTKQVTICHKGTTMQVPPSALFGHLRHHDRLGACAPAAASCPCFTSAGLADVAAQCSVPPTASCADPYSISLYCAPGGGSGTVGNLGLFEAKLGTGTCSTTAQDLMTGTDVTTTQPVTNAQFEACRQAIVGNAYYPASCPR
jgi:hypothetical protein